MTRPLVALDVDGNIIKSVEMYQGVFSDVAESYGVPKERHDGYLIRTTGDPLENQFGTVMGLPDNHPQVLEACSRWRKIAHAPDRIAPLYDDVVPCFEALKRSGYRLCATSSMKQDHLDRTAAQYKFGEWLDFWLGTTDPDVPKPLLDKKSHKPMIIERYGIAPEEFERVSYLNGDGKGDMRIAKIWGSKGVFTVRRGFEDKTREDVKKLLTEEGCEPFAVILSLTELPDVVAYN